MPRPPAYKFPDPAAWEARYGLKPYPLAEVPAFLARNAATAIQKDWSTLDLEDACRLQATLDSIFQTVEATMRLPVGHDAQFDGRQFWAFPRPEKLPPAAERMPLLDAVERNREHPESFFIPGAAELAEIQAGDFVQLASAWKADGERKGGGERFWVQVTRKGETPLAMAPVIVPPLEWQGVIEQTDMVAAHIHGYATNTPVEFTSRNILKTMTAADILSGTVRDIDKPKK
jgi:hypothetical protein